MRREVTPRILRRGEERKMKMKGRIRSRGRMVKMRVYRAFFWVFSLWRVEIRFSCSEVSRVSEKTFRAPQYHERIRYTEYASNPSRQVPLLIRKEKYLGTSSLRVSMLVDTE